MPKWAYVGMAALGIGLISYLFSNNMYLQGRINKSDGKEFVQPTVAALAPTTVPTQEHKEEIYTVKPGDTLGRIAQQYNTTVGELVALNNIPDPNKISVGHELKIPYSSGIVAKPSAVTSAAPPSEPAAKPYIVREYPERREDGSVWLVRQWSNGRYESIGQVEMAYTPTPQPAAKTQPQIPSCGISVGYEFGRLWTDMNLQQTLGCPVERFYSNIWSAEEAFQNGTMLWRSYGDMVFVLTNDGFARKFDAKSNPNLVFHEGEPEKAGYNPPSGLLEPIRGFGKVWRSELGGPNARIGWATEDERGFHSSIQDFEKGSLFRNDRGIVYIIQANDRWRKVFGY